MCRSEANGPKASGGRAGFVTWALTALCVLAAVNSWAAPANDNFAKARVISGSSSGSSPFSENTTGATKEPGEPNHAGNAGGASVWFSWTAPFSGPVQFNTEGSGFDTLLAVYTGTSVSQLTPVAAGDDVNFPGDLTSRTTFTANSGTTYYIAVDGFGGATGILDLSWSPSGVLSAGSFFFVGHGSLRPRTKEPVYAMSERQSTNSLELLVAPSPAVVTISRTNGSSGWVQVHYSLTNSIYTNYFTTNIFGTNLYQTNIDSTGVSYTNVFSTNVVTVLDTNFYYLDYRTNETILATNFLYSDTNLSLSQVVTNIGTNYTLPTTCGNLPPLITTTLSTNTTTTSTNIATNILVSVVFCTNFTVTNYTASATNTDYLQTTGVVDFVDYQMTTNITLLVFPTRGFHLDPLIQVRLDSVSFAPGENTNIGPPVIATTNAFVNLLPHDATASDIGGLTNVISPSDTILNFEKSYSAIAEQNANTNGGGRQLTFSVYLTRNGTNFANGASVDYTIDFGGSPPGPEGNNTFTNRPESDYATPSNPSPRSQQSPDFITTSGTVSWGANDASPKPISITITNDGIVEFNEDLLLQLTNATGGVIGQVGTHVLTILFNDQPAGAVDREHNMNDSSWTVPPFNENPGANNTVYAVAVQPADGLTVMAGGFTSYNSVPRNRIARMAVNGAIDPTFLAAPNSGANDLITSLALAPDGGIFIGGSFSSFNGTNRYGIARLLASGDLDLSFKPGLGIQGTVWALALQSDLKLLAAGTFTLAGGTNRNYIARFNPDGSIDSTFDPGVGPNDTVNALALQPDGRILIGGSFTSVNGTNRQSIARLLPNGVMDPSFDPGLGADGEVFALAVQPDTRVLIGGGFSTVNLLNHNHLARLNADGSIDLNFDNGSGPNDTVYTIVPQTDGTIYVGGRFTAINGTRRIGLGRLLPDGPVDTSFLDTAYNQFAGLINLYSTAAQAPNFLLSIALQADGKLIIGGGFSLLGGDGFTAPLWGTWNRNPGGSRSAVAPRQNVARLIGGATPGPGNISLAQNSYSVDENAGSAFISLVRLNGTLGPAAMSFSPVSTSTGSGAAAYGTNYSFNTLRYGSPTWGTSYGNPLTSWMRQDGLSGPNYLTTNIFGGFEGSGSQVFVAISNAPAMNGNRSLDLQLSLSANPDIFFLGGANIPVSAALGRSHAPLTILDDETFAGGISFSAAAYTVNENGTNAVISVVRTNGSTGIVTVNYSTAPAPNNPPFTTNAVAGFDYTPVSGQLTFNTGETNKTFLVPILNNTLVQLDHTLFVSLSSVSGTKSTGLTNALLTIVDDDLVFGHINFSSTNFSAHETGGRATITATRTGGNQGVVSVSCATSDGTAINGIDYTGVTNTLTWNNNDAAPKSFTIPVFHDGLVITNNKALNLRLFNAVLNSVPESRALGPVTNATLTILNDDAYGRPSFSVAGYYVNNNSGSVTITVVRQGGSAQTITVNYATSDLTAVAGTHYGPVSGTLVFNPGVFSQSFTVPIYPNNGTVGYGQLTFGVQLSGPTPASGPGGAVALGSVPNAVVTIVDVLSYNEPPGGVDTTFNPNSTFDGTVYTVALQPDGKILAGGDFLNVNGSPRNRVVRLNADGTIDPKFSSATEGTDGTVRTIALQSDGRVLLGGNFATLAGVNSSFLGRINQDGSPDTSFNPGSGADAPVYAIAETFDTTGAGSARKVLVAGGFTTLNGQPRHNFGRLNDDGTPDATFAPSGANGVVYALAVYATNDVNAGKILIGGDFTTVNGQPRNHIARLNPDGSLDASFDPGAGPNDSVRAIAIQVDGKAVIGGVFTSVSGAALSHVARLNPDGSVDGSFNVGTGVNDVVDSIVLQEDLKILLAGSFTQGSGVTRNRLTRLNADGTVDPSINFGLGANDFIAAMAVQPDDRIVIGGGFTTFDGQSRPHLARIYGRTVQGAGAVQFTSATYTVIENATNAVVTVRRTGGTDGIGYVDLVTSDGTAVAGTDYQNVNTTLTFPVGETLASATIPVIEDFVVDGNLTVNLALQNASGVALGNQPSAVLTIINDNSTVSFSSASYRITKNTGQGAAIIFIERAGSTIGTASVDFMTTTNGTALPGVDFTPVTNTVVFNPGDTERIVSVPIINNGLVEGDRTVDLILTNQQNTILTGPSDATLTIVDNNLAPGTLAFSTNNYSVLENASTSNSTATALITVLRTNGLSGQVSVQFNLSGGTAIAGTDFIATNNTLVFADGEFSKSFAVVIPHNPLVTGNRIVNISLTNATGGAVLLAPTTVPLTIVDQDVGFGFGSPGYFVNETAGSVGISVLRIGRTNGPVSVQYATGTNGTARDGVNYSAVSGTLSFASGETLKIFTVPVLYDPRVTGNLIFPVSLFNPSPGAQLSFQSAASVTVIDADTGLAFATNSAVVHKTGTNVLVTVVRTGNFSGTNTVGFMTSDGTAQAGVRYVATNGLLTFVAGQTTNAFAVAIINDQAVEGDQTFNVSLINPMGGAQLLSPSNEVVTVLEDNTGFAFSSAAYRAVESGVLAPITVVRSGVLTNYASVDYSTADGTGTNGVHYVAASGTLSFAPGDTSKTFNVQIIDNGVPDPDATVILSLAHNPTNTAVALVSPSAAVLTILDDNGGLIVPSGTALTQESYAPANGVIDPGERVTVLFGLRNASGQTVSNLTVSLLATNGVTLVAPASTSYGTLVAGGPSAFQPFSFTASGTNGQSITAVLRVSDGVHPAGLASFGFTLGSRPFAFTNSNLMVINDYAAATPYPSTINVAGINGQVGKVTLTVSNLTHAFLSDVDMLLVGPAGQKSLLMAHVGGGHSVTNVTITFDDGATNSLTVNAPTNGSYKPTQFASGITFPVPAPPGPYATNLAAFTGSNPNGVWSLYVQDDNPLDSGAISNGWSLAFTTAAPVIGSADLGVAVVASPDPVVATSNLTYTVSATNFGPAGATGVFLTNTLPPGVGYNSSSLIPSSIATNGGQITLVYSLNTLTTNNGVVVPSIMAANAGTVVTINATAPLSSGPITNLAILTADQPDANPVDNLAATVTGVSTATADLAIGLTGSPDPVTLGGTLVYNISVTNLGPASAIGVLVTDVLPAGINFISASGGGTNNAGTVTFNLGVMGSGAVSRVVLTVQPTAGGTFTNTVTVASTIGDPFKGNNRASAKTVVQGTVQPVQLSATLAPGGPAFAWPVSAGNYVLEYTPQLVPSAWSAVTNPAPVVVNGQNTFTPGQPGFYRLRATIP